MAMDIHQKLTRAIVAYLPEKALSRAEQRSRPHKDTPYTWDETYTLPENLFLSRLSAQRQVFLPRHGKKVSRGRHLLRSPR